jgi:NTE family protein
MRTRQGSQLRWLLALAIGVGATPPALAAPEPPVVAVQAVPPVFTASNRPRIGLVLGGGGAKGFAHIGVIEELERRRIPIDVIAGTSMGAVVGSMYAIGNDAEEIKKITGSIDWKNVFNDNLQRIDLSFRRKREVREIFLNARLGVDNGKAALPTGIFGGQKLFSTVQELLAPWRATEDFNNLPIPFRAVATNIVTGQPVAMGSGNFSTAVFASMSIPAAFPPVEREGLLLVDGGISNNLPVDVARQMGVDVVIVVDVGEPPAAAEKITSALSVFNQMQLLLGYDAIRRQRASIAGRDVLVEPDITGLSVTAFDKAELGIERGRAAAQKMGDRLAALSVDEAQWRTYLAEREARRHPAPIRIDKVQIVNTSKLPTEDIAPLVTTAKGDILDGRIMARDVAALYALDEFDRVDYKIDIAPGENTLVVNAKGSRNARKYFQTGIVIASNFGKSATFDIAAGYTDRDFLGTGAEWRGFARVGSDVLFDVNLYKQVGGLFVEPTAFFQRYSSVLVQQGSMKQTAAVQVTRAGAGIDGGMVFGNWGELRAGVRIGGLNPGDESATLGIPGGWNRDVDWRLGFTVDTLDALNFPRSGVFAQVQYVDHVAALGGEFRRNNLTLNVQKPISFDRATLILGGRLGTTSQASNDFLGDFQTGGFLNLSGLTRNSLIGPQLLFGRAVGFYRLSGKSPIIDLPIYVGGSLEAGNVWSLRSDISLGSLRTAASVFVAADTPIGPVWLAYGQSGSTGSVYFVLGRVF